MSAITHHLHPPPSTLHTIIHQTPSLQRRQSTCPDEGQREEATPKTKALGRMMRLGTLSGVLLLVCTSWPQLSIITPACGFSFLSSFHTNHVVHNVERRSVIGPMSASSTSSSSNLAINLDASSSSAAAVLDFYANLDSLYDKSSSIKCPFFRRRAADLIDNAAMVLQFLLIRHKSLPFISDLFLDNESSTPGELSALASDSIINLFSAPGCKPVGRHIKRMPDGTAQKTRHLAIEEIMQRIHDDWTGGVAGEDKGYYITGKLDSTIYRDDCLFTGPDPDMPVRGLRKYLSAAAQLFDSRQSYANMLSIKSHENGGQRGKGMIEVTWRLGGVIQLPWHPTVEPWTGKTYYHMDEEGLVYMHEEGWDISMLRAFMVTLYPQTKNWRIWELEKVSVHP